MNLFATLHTVLSPDVLSRVAAYIDEPADKTSKAVDGLVYTIVGGLMKRITSEIGVNQLYNHIQKGRYDGSLTDNIVTVIRDPSQTNTLITQGNDVISHLLPAMKSSIGSMISAYAGVRNSSAISLLGLITTVVLHVLGKQAKAQKLDADGLASTLFAERDALISAVPEEFMPQLIEKLGLQQVMAGVAIPTRRGGAETSERAAANGNRSATTVTRPAVSYIDTDDSDNDNSSLAKWGIGALLALAVAAGGYYIYQNTQKYSGDGVSDVTTVTGDTVQVDTVNRSLAVPKDTTTKAPTKPTSTSAVKAPVSIPPTSATTAGGLTQAMTPYLDNAALPKGRVFPLAGVAFQPSSLSLTPGSQGVINELATLLKTYPKAQVQLVGYANDAQLGLGFTNKSLSFKRVNQIKQQLMASGIDFLRIDAIGRGTGVSKRDTSGIPKPTLRKIDVKVVIK
jgi:outer membrane protein OmpA-like peptidoglycan-associated protein